jgi:hypothetical protein
MVHAYNTSTPKVKVGRLGGGSQVVMNTEIQSQKNKDWERKKWQISNPYHIPASPQTRNKTSVMSL